MVINAMGSMAGEAGVKPVASIGMAAAGWLADEYIGRTVGNRLSCIAGQHIMPQSGGMCGSMPDRMPFLITASILTN